MRIRPTIAAVGVLVVYLALATTWSYVIPLGGGIDEPRHLRYVQIVAEEARLPTVAEKQEAISHHPPLHYLLAAPVYLATRGLGREASWHAVRFVSVLLGAVGILVVFAMLRRALPQRPWAGVVGMAAVGWLPHYQLVSAMVSNDVTAALAGALALYAATRAITEPERSAVFAFAAGIAAGAGVMAKMNALVLLPAPLLAVTIAPMLSRRTPEASDERQPPPGPHGAMQNALACAVAFLGTGGITIGYHLMKWGRLESDPPWPEAAWPVHTFGAKLLRAIGGLFRSTWAQVGWLPGPHSPPPPGPTARWPRPDLETPLLALALMLTLAAIVGSVVLAVRWLRSEQTRGRGLAMAMLLLASALMYGVLVQNAIYVNPGRYEGGRYLLPAVAASMALLAIGPLALPRRWRIAAWVATPAMLLVMNAVAFWEFYAYLIPTFAP
ncbi:MAG: glycosyltransferase family 39 protein [Armatimonadota bacterium]|nr:glycosyltransferase family 39 protein [Armatimonadota bacterium]